MASTALPISICSLLVSFLSFVFSVHHWRRSFRPIVSVMVKTHQAGNVSIAYDLVVLNSGTLPARNVHIAAEPASPKKTNKDGSPRSTARAPQFDGGRIDH
jgi:hypothetical protein